ncbi:MAG: OB-fold nucleic acid binding domain-containing protein [Paeniclostridium sp.]
MEEKVREMQISSPTPVEEEEEKYIIKEEHEDENLIYGENVNALFEHICDIDKNAKTVCIVGEIFNIETKELKNGKILLIADVTDNTSSISCKLFLNDLNQDKVLSKISEGTNVRIKGDVIYDTFKRELTMTISGIRLEDKKPRVDKADKNVWNFMHIHKCHLWMHYAKLKSL